MLISITFGIINVIYTIKTFKTTRTPQRKSGWRQEMEPEADCAENKGDRKFMAWSFGTAINVKPLYYYIVIVIILSRVYVVVVVIIFR